MGENNQQIKQSNLSAAIEALLFVYGEPISIEKIAEILNRDAKLQITSEPVNKSKFEFTEIIKKSVEELNQQYLADNRGLMLIFSNNQVQLTTKPDFASILENFIKEEFKENLTPASLETLALIAYSGPMSRVQIDYYRGVNSSFILRNLLIRGLIERFPASKDNINHSANNYPSYSVGVYLYQPSFDLLKYLGISKIEELPEYEKFKNIKINNEV